MHESTGISIQMLVFGNVCFLLVSNAEAILNFPTDGRFSKIAITRGTNRFQLRRTEKQNSLNRVKFLMFTEITTMKSFLHKKKH